MSLVITGARIIDQTGERSGDVRIADGRIAEVGASLGASGDDDNGEGSGSAYVFERIGGAWTETAKLTASDGAPGDAFGFAVDVDGDVALVGAWLDDDNGNDSGSAYAFERIEGVWNETAKLSAPDFGPFDFFGDSVSVSGATAVVSAIRDDDAGNNAGAAYVFEKIDGAWTQTAKLTGADTEAYDNFGDWVSLSGSTLLIGAWQDDDNGTDSGSAYVFERGGGVWTETAKLTAADGAEGDHFGWAVGVGDDVAVVGANFDDDHGDGSGSAYVFKRVGAKWTQAAKVNPSGGAAADLFGNAIALGGDAAFIASPADDDNGTESGSVFVFDLNCSCPADVSGDGELSILDFIVFQALWQDGDPGADCDANGVFNVLDFVCFQQLFQEGCQ